MANPLLAQCVLQEMQKFGLVSFGGNASRSWQWPWYSSQTEQQCQLKVNIMSNRKVMLTKDAPLSSHLADYVCKLDNFFLTSQTSKVFSL